MLAQVEPIWDQKNAKAISNQIWKHGLIVQQVHQKYHTQIEAIPMEHLGITNVSIIGGDMNIGENLYVQKLLVFKS